MDKLKRIGTVLLVLGLSLLLITVVRGGSPEIGQRSLKMNPDQQVSSKEFMYPRDLKLEIQAQTPITFKLVAPSGRLIVNLPNIATSISYTCHLVERGVYNVSVYNPSNVTTQVTIVTTFYNFESDLMEFSFALIVVGAILAITSVFIRFNRRKVISSYNL